MRRKALLVLLAAALALVAPACGDDDDDGAAGPDLTATTASSAPPDTTGATSTTAPGGEPGEAVGDTDETGKSELEDGRHYGYWVTFDIGDVSAVGEFDVAYFLTGAEAEAAAAERGDEVNNDYYVVNDNPKLRTLVAKGDTEVLVLAGEGADLSPTNVADFAVDRHEDSGFWVTIVDGIVSTIEEQFVP